MRGIGKTLLLWLLCGATLYATHNRAGEITYRHLSGYTYEVTVTTYTYALSSAKRTELIVQWGDGTETEVPLLDPPGFYAIPGTDYLKNMYVAQHTYAGSGVYEILMEDPNRNLGVNNIPNSVNTIFSIKTTLFIGSNIGSNNTPVLLNPPIDQAALGHPFIHNPAAFDPDGDSISYTITTCTGAGGEAIEGYRIPAATDTLLVDARTGDLMWLSPPVVGKFNIAILVEEWRDQIRIGRIARDMQIDVHETDNNPPINPNLIDLCVRAGDTINLQIRTSDPDQDQLNQSLVGGPFEVTNPAVYSIDSSGYGWINSHFQWITHCSHARQQPYTLVLKTEDITNDINLVSVTSFTIRVLHLPPTGLETHPGSDTIRLEWTPSNCGTPAGYRIYRRTDSTQYLPEACETGVPARTGFVLIDQVEGATARSYTDNNGGSGLVPGFEYCYRITAYYNDGAESISSEEICSHLEPGNPPLLRVSVAADDETAGQIELAWAVPRGDDIMDDGPYRYEILRMAPGETTLRPIFTQQASPNLFDTTFTDRSINTRIYPYTYSVILQYEEGGTWHNAPGNEMATSQYISTAGADNTVTLTMKKRAPWLNQPYEMYRAATDSFMHIGSTLNATYTDRNLRNNTTYTYRSVAKSVRPLYGMNFTMENTSHLASEMPVDTLSPCDVELYVRSDCDSVRGFNLLSWQRASDSCSNQDVVNYIIYSRDSLEGKLFALDTLAPTVFEYLDYPKNSIEQCYAITAIDSAGNESTPLPYCVYNICSFYRLPNVFTPNGDAINDIYTSWNLNGYVKKVDMSIFNRYGQKLYTTTNANIDWNGTYNNKLVSSGVYYYICDVYEPTIRGSHLTTLTGFIHVYSGTDNTPPQ